MLSMIWKYKHFSELSLTELFKIYKLRTAIFVVEQHCPYQEVDDNDLISTHLFAENNGELTAYCRIFLHKQKIKIGRVVVSEKERGKGLGYELMQKAVQFCKENHSEKSIFIQAQEHLKNFYQTFGFLAVSSSYLEDGIAHIDMEITC